MRLARFYTILVVLLAVVPPAGWAQRTAEETWHVGSLSIDGNETLSDAELRRAIRTTGAPFITQIPLLGRLGSRPVFDQLEFRRDVLRLQALYRVRGYPDIVVDTILKRDDGLVDVKFVISEGDPEIISSITLVGLDDVISRRQILSALPATEGDPLDRIALQSAVSVIEGEFRNRGFPFVTVSASVRSDTARYSADLLFSVNRGPRATIGEVQVVGTQRIDPRVVLQTVSIREGDQYSEDALYESQFNLYTTGLFSFANVTLADSNPGSPDTAVTVKIQVDLAEGPMEKVRIGGGYGTMDCFRALGRMDLNNLLGGGRILDFRASTSKIGVGQPLGGLENSFLCRTFQDEDTSRLKLNYRVSATVHEPLLFARNTRMTASVFAERYTEFQAYLRQSIGMRLSATRTLDGDIPLTLSYNLSRGKTVADPVTLCQYLSVCLVGDTRFFTEPRRRSVVSLSVARDRTHSLYNADAGSVLHAEASWASRITGSDSLIQFARGVVEYSSYHHLSEKVVLAWRARAGAVLSPSLGFTTGDRAYIPPEDRFYLGGPNTVRGYAQNRLGPVVYVLDTVITSSGIADSSLRVSASGGELVALGNLELRFPLGGGGRFRAVAFIDAGFVGDRVGEVGDRFRVTPGAGIRVGTAVGPIRFDVGYNPHTSEPGSLFMQDGSALVELTDSYLPAKNWLDRLRLHFSLGQAF